MFLVVGLGNPGAGYTNNRHNIGFMAVDEIVRRHSFSSFRSKFDGEIAQGTIDGETVLALKPQTYMNLSGNSVLKAASFYKIPPENIIVIHDDLDLAPAKLKVKQGGGSGGHNGIKSIDANLGANYHRIRLGIGHPQGKMEVANFVLADFAKADGEWLEPLLKAVAEALPLFLNKSPAAFATKVSLLINPKPAPKPKAEKPVATPENKIPEKSDDAGGILRSALEKALGLVHAANNKKS